MVNNITPIVRNLLIINVLIFIFEQMSQLDLGLTLGLRNFNATGFRPYQLITYMFLHGDLRHLFSNMFGLFIFGPMLERIWGTNRFLFFYFFTGIGAGLLNLGINYFENIQVLKAIQIYSQHPTPESFLGFLNKYGIDITLNSHEYLQNFKTNPTNQALINETINFAKNSYQQIVDQGNMVGASGAIFGIIMAFGYLFPNTEMMILFIPFPIKAKYLVTFYGLYELYAGIQRSQGDNIAHFAHLGGMFFAIILLKYWGSARNKFY
jgi:membrane associated rhomboid family serine protease